MEDFSSPPSPSRTPPVLAGLDILARDGHPLLAGRRVGLLIHQASVDRQLRHALDVLVGRDDFRVATLFGPQHGLWGTTQDNMIEWEGFVDPRLGLPVHSLYGEVRKPTPRMLEGLEAMIIDLVDVGARYYTFVWTATLVMEACREVGIPVLVLDRPNPVNGLDIEGPSLDRAFSSFVGRFPIPMRHGLTLGEMLRMFNDTEGIGCDLTVVACEGWRRDMWQEETGLPFAMPSPNMPLVETAVVYPGMCLFEGTMLSEGRGTTRPFEIAGAPGIDAHALVQGLRGEDLPGVLFRPLYFEPTFQKHARKECGGVFIHVLDRAGFRPVRTAVALISHMRRMLGEAFRWKDPPYEYETVKLPFDILAGSEGLRRQIEAGMPLAEMAAEWRADEQAFARRRERWLLYPSSPREAAVTGGERR